MIPTEVKATPIILLRPRRQLLALCISQSFDTKVTEQKTLTYQYTTVETAPTTTPIVTSSLFIIYFVVKLVIPKTFFLEKKINKKKCNLAQKLIRP